MKLHFVYIGIPIELGNLLVLKEVRTRPEANKAIEEIVKDLDDLYADFKEKCAQNLSNNTGNNTHVQLGFNLEYIATRLNEHSPAFDGLPVITSTSESVAKQVSSALKKLESGRKQIKLSKKSSRTWITYTRPSKKSVRRICRTIPATTPMYNLDLTLNILRHV